MQILRRFGVFAAATFVAAGACGGGGEHMPAEPAEEPMTQDSAAKASEFPLGGGTATEVHPGAGGSPHVAVDWMVGGATISITYGRPYLKDRVVGESVEPMQDRVWRLGADEATSLVTDKDLMIDGTHIPAGEYTLWTRYVEDEMQLIVNTETGQWGTAYNSDHDMAYIPLAVTELDPPAEQLVITVTEEQFGFEWGHVAATASLMVHS